METIKNYLENMFSQLPNTPEVQKAKYELYQMMEDKYNELISEGKSDNEAIGVVISEFGNLDELADTLGIKSFVTPQTAMPASKTLSREAAADFLKCHSKHAFLTAFGVLLCIISCVAPIFADTVPASFASSDVSDAVGVTIFLVCIAFAVGLFIISNSLMGKWDYLKKEPYCIDFETANWLHEKKESYRTTHSIFLTLGIMLCILCAVPPVILSTIKHSNDFIDALSGALVLIFIAFGVFLIVCTNIRKSGFDKLLGLNGSGTVGGNFVSSQKQTKHSDNPVINAILSVYWPTVTCIYLCLSFLTFRWDITWLIWPVAGVVYAVL